MKISDVLRKKGDEVVTVRSDDTVSTLLAKLAELGAPHGILELEP